MSGSSATVPARSLQAAVADLQVVRPGPGLAQVAVRAAGLLACLAVAVPAWWGGEVVVYAVGALGVGFWWASLLILTHDAVHHTLTGIPRLDDLLGRVISWPVLWCHATFFQVHSLHHRMNGADLHDPERVHPTAAEIAAARGLARFRLRHAMVWDMVVRGAAGLIFETVVNAWRHRAARPKVKRALAEDLVGALLSAAAVHGGAFLVAEAIAPGRGLHMVLGTLILWLAIERVTGHVMYFRKYVEHYGLWEEGAHFFETQVFSTRNIHTNRALELLFSGLNYHSVHHAFPRIPSYGMAEAHRRVDALYRAAGRPLPIVHGYDAAFREVWATSWARVP